MLLPAQNVAEAAIVNYYGEKSTLGGHLDNVEPDQEAPIVSVSLGCPAVFLIGGASHDVEPDAILLRGGDVVVMSGSARRCLHGVPLVVRIVMCHVIPSIGWGRQRQ